MAVLAKLAAFVALIPLLSACGISNPIASSATPSPISTGPTGPAGQSPSAAPQPGALSAEIEIDIAGGANAGSYRAVAPGGCVNEPAQNTLAVRYANDLAVDGFVALHLVLRDVAQAQQDVSEDFVVEISVGGVAGGISYTIDPTNGEGDGVALLDNSPFDATLDLTADVSDGAQIVLTVICGSP